MEIINYHTISDFRTAHKESLDQLFVQTLGIMSAEGLVTLERVTHDGTKVKACAGADGFRRAERIRRHLKTAEEHIRLLQESSEEEIGLRRQKAEERSAREKKERMERALSELIEGQGRKEGRGSPGGQGEYHRSRLQDHEAIGQRLRPFLQSPGLDGLRLRHYRRPGGKPASARLQ